VHTLNPEYPVDVRVDALFPSIVLVLVHAGTPAIASVVLAHRVIEPSLAPDTAAMLLTLVHVLMPTYAPFPAAGNTYDSLVPAGHNLQD